MCCLCIFHVLHCELADLYKEPHLALIWKCSGPGGGLASFPGREEVADAPLQQEQDRPGPQQTASTWDTPVSPLEEAWRTPGG